MVGGVGYGMDEVVGFGENLCEVGEVFVGEDGEDEFVGGEFGEVWIEFGELLGFVGEDEGVGVV